MTVKYLLGAEQRVFRQELSTAGIVV